MSVEMLWEGDASCHYCGCDLERGDETPAPLNRATIDHVIPRSAGGAHHISNLVLCCLSCNSSKGGRSLAEFRRIRARKTLNMPAFTPEQMAWLSVVVPDWPDLDSFPLFFEDNTGEKEEAWVGVHARFWRPEQRRGQAA